MNPTPDSDVDRIPRFARLSTVLFIGKVNFLGDISPVLGDRDPVEL